MPDRTDTPRAHHVGLTRRHPITGGLLLCTLLTPLLALAADVPPPPPLNGGTQPAAAPSKHAPLPGAAPRLPPPPLPDVNKGKHSLEPEVTIIKRKHAVIEEYRVHGILRYVKITPDKGPPYYLIDTTGNGQLDTRSDNLDNPPINQWILFRW